MITAWKGNYAEKLNEPIGNFVKFIKKLKASKIQKTDFSRFNTPIFEKLWAEHKDALASRKKEIKKVLTKEGKSAFKKFLEIVHLERFPYKKLIIFIVFPKLVSIKPKIFAGTGGCEQAASTCIVKIGIPKWQQIYTSKDLDIFWHELIHSLQPTSKENEIIWEAVARTYEQLILEKPKEIEEKVRPLFEKGLSQGKIKKLTKICSSWDWKKQNIFELSSELLQELRRQTKKV